MTTGSKKNLNNRAGKKILIVEDDASLRNVLRDQFILEGMVVFQAKNGEEGLDLALREHPDMILLDVVMPKMDGITMLKNLRGTNEWGKNVKIIVLTNLSKTGKIASDLLKEEIYDYIVKADTRIEDIVTKVCERFDK